MPCTESTAFAQPAASAQPPQLNFEDDYLTSEIAMNPDASGEVQLTQLFRLSPDLLALASSASRRWMRVNPAFKTVLGWSEHELIGRPVTEIVYAADIERFETAQNSLEERGVANVEIRLNCKGGGCRWVAWKVALDKQDDSLSFSGRDMTPTRRIIKNLRSTAVRVQHENENLEQFVRTAGHDLQEPLRTLTMYSDLLLRKYGEQMPGHSTELLLQIFGAASRMQLLLHDLLTYARTSQETDPPRDHFKDSSLERIFDEVVGSLKSSIEDSSATITHDPLPEVHGDQTQLAQLLQNLLSNSLKYRRSDVPLTIHVGVERKCGEWQFQMTDNGHGFDPQYADDIFLDFKRLHGREIPGTGLGLSICQRIVQRHGGRIWAEGRPGEGATFWFTLPTHAPAFASVARTPAAEA